MNKLIIIAGPQGSGKTTWCNWLREQVPHTNLLRLTGGRDKTKDGLYKVVTSYYNLLNYLDSMKEMDFDFIIENMFFAEQVFASLGYKEYDFGDEFMELVKCLNDLEYEIHVINLFCNRTQYEERLKRDKFEFLNVAYSVENSMDQQKCFHNVCSYASKYGNIKVTHLECNDMVFVRNTLSDMFVK